MDWSDNILKIPEVVSSVPPYTPFIFLWWIILCSSAPSSITTCGFVFETLKIFSKNSFLLGFFFANTFISLYRKNSIISAWIDRGFAEQMEICAPKAFAAIIRTEVSFVICKQNPKLKFDNGFDLWYFFNILIIPFIRLVAHSYSNFPLSTISREGFLGDEDWIFI